MREKSSRWNILKIYSISSKQNQTMWRYDYIKRKTKKQEGEFFITLKNYVHLQI